METIKFIYFDLKYPTFPFIIKASKLDDLMFYLAYMCYVICNSPSFIYFYFKIFFKLRLQDIKIFPELILRHPPVHHDNSEARHSPGDVTAVVGADTTVGPASVNPLQN